MKQEASVGQVVLEHLLSREVEPIAPLTFDEAGSFRWSGRVAESPFVQEVERSATIFDEAREFPLVRLCRRHLLFERK
jgi:hypothetical protein